MVLRGPERLVGALKCGGWVSMPSGRGNQTTIKEDSPLLTLVTAADRLSGIYLSNNVGRYSQANLR